MHIGTLGHLAVAVYLRSRLSLFQTLRLTSYANVRHVLNERKTI